MILNSSMEALTENTCICLIVLRSLPTTTVMYVQCNNTFNSIASRNTLQAFKLNLLHKLVYPRKCFGLQLDYSYAKQSTA